MILDLVSKLHTYAIQGNMWFCSLLKNFRGNNYADRLVAIEDNFNVGSIITTNVQKSLKTTERGNIYTYIISKQ